MTKLSDHARQLALQTVVSDPHLLWEILSPGGPAPLILGPWVPAREIKPDGSFGSGTPGGVWRKPPGKNLILADGATVRKSTPLSHYEPRDPHDYDDEEDYEYAVEKYEQLVRVWKPFVYRVKIHKPLPADAGPKAKAMWSNGLLYESVGYADTMRGGVDKADEILRGHGVLLVPNDGTAGSVDLDLLISPDTGC